jgi:hypothetical protein
MIIKLVSIPMCASHISRVCLFIDFFVQDDYRITDFGASNPKFTPDGRQFYVADVEEHFRPSDDLLRDHYRQCVLACMKAAAGPANLRRFDPDINLGPGGFNLEDGSWWSGPEGKEQMEVELAARLHRTSISRGQDDQTL